MVGVKSSSFVRSKQIAACGLCTVDTHTGLTFIFIHVKSVPQNIAEYWENREILRYAFDVNENESESCMGIYSVSHIMSQHLTSFSSDLPILFPQSSTTDHNSKQRTLLSQAIVKRQASSSQRDTRLQIFHSDRRRWSVV
jgi:hypothetical protein